MSSDDELRALLEKIAATAGDPPEHGLDGVVARRRRRTRHRRGAVATAVALAVLGLTTLPRVGLLGNDDHDLTAADTQSGPRRTELPRVVDVRCTPLGIDVPVASIQPQHDGLHLRVDNSLGGETDVWVTSDNRRWDSGRISVPVGVTEKHVPAPPGALTVGCAIAGLDQKRSVQLVDVDGHYTAPELDCPDDDRVTRNEQLPVPNPTPSLPTATRTALNGHVDWTSDDGVAPLTGYTTSRYNDITADPSTQVERNGDTVAIVHLDGPATSPDGGPWVKVWRIEACKVFVEHADDAGATTSTPPATP